MWHSSHKLVVLAIALLGAALHLGALWNEPVFDDLTSVAENQVTERPFDLAAHFGNGSWGPDRPDVTTWRPVATLTLAWNRAVHGLNPLGFRLVNLLLHALATALVMIWMRRLGIGMLATALAGSLFAVHPIHVDAIIPFAARADLLLTVFVLFSFLLFEDKRYILSAVCLALALLCKEMALVAAIWLVLRYWSAGFADAPEDKTRHWWWTLPLAVATAWFFARWLALGQIGAAQPGVIDNPLAQLPYLERIAPALSLYLRAVTLFVAPFSLAADLSYAAFVPASVTLAASIAGGLLLLGTIALATVAWRRWPSVFAGLSLWLLGYLLVSHLGPTMPMIFAERTLYLPSVGLMLALGFVFEKLLSLPRQRTATVVTTAIVVAIFSLRSAVRVGDFKDPQTFYERLLSDAPGNLKALTNLSNLAFAAGDPEMAVGYAEQALAVGGDTWLAHLNAAQVYIALHNGPKAAEHLVFAERLAPESAGVISARCALAARFSQLGAVESCSRAAQLGSDPLTDLIHFAVAHANTENHEEAEALFRQALEKEGVSGVRALHGFSIYLARKGDLEAARAVLVQGLARQSDSPLLLQTLQQVEGAIEAKANEQPAPNPDANR